MFTQLFSVLLLVPAISGLSLTAKLVSSTSTTQICSTRMASTSAKGPIPTTTKTKTKLPNIVIIGTTSVPIKTITPAAITRTATITSLETVTATASTISETFSTTETLTDTSTISITLTSVETTTTTSSTTTTATTVVPTSAGFRDICSSSGRSNFANQKRAVSHPHAGLARRAPSKSPKGVRLDLQKYPAAVTCDKYIQVRYTKEIILVKPTSTKTAATPTAVVSTTATVTETSTVVPPNVSTTLSFTTTTTASTTSTITSSSTATSTASVTETTTTTSYAACATNNVLGPRVDNGNYLTRSFYNDVDNQVIQVVASSGYECCVACITSTLNCHYASYGEGACSLVAGSPRCDPNYADGTFFEGRSPPGYSLQLSNGNCGSLRSGGLLD
ncbi:MAG: hypothetical protein M1837_002460 [Sclerophora amabilis]|nr:MAG: hypothetical protein M1837_002460 [Sclerophora amabilis]